MSEEDYYLLFSLLPGIGAKRFNQLLLRFETIKWVWEALNNKDPRLKELEIGDKTLEKFDAFEKSFSVEEYKERLQNVDVTFVSQINKHYPKDLLELESAPIGLFVKGDTSLLTDNYSSSEAQAKSRSLNDYSSRQARTIAVVGTRKVTSYGRTVTETLVSGLVSHNFVIVSGLALGVDAIAHMTALAHQGRTLAVLGCGVDCCYPKVNERLYLEIFKKQGLIISEYPLGTIPAKGNFPARNRIISALSKGVLVTEAGADSGSLITADYAKKEGKPIFAVPGPITSKQSDGTSYLLKNGAKLVQNVVDIIQEFRIQSSEFGMNKKLDIDSLNITNEEKEVLKLLEHEEISLDDLAQKSGLKVGELSILLSSLEMQGYIKNLGAGVYSLSLG